MPDFAVTLIAAAKIGDRYAWPGDTVTVSPGEVFQLAEAGAIPPLTADELAGLASAETGAGADAPATERDELLERLSAAEGRAALAETDAFAARNIVEAMHTRVTQLEGDLAHMDAAAKELAAELAASKALIAQLQAPGADSTQNTPPSEPATKKKAATKES